MKLNKNKKYILGLSGGPDSIFLLHYLLSNKINNIIACHVNYNYRENSKIDEEICKEICNRNNIKLKILNLDNDYSFLKENFEAWARNQRYHFFKTNLEKYKADAILIAHNMNDHIETFLMQKENSKIVNYYGIKDETILNNCKVIRPILEFKKQYILNFLNEHNINYAIDSTNWDLKFTRNKIRAKLNENDFNKYILEIKQKNKQLKIINSEINKKLKKLVLEVSDFKNQDFYDLRLLFKYFEIKNFGCFFYNAKKAVLKEILKQLRSNNSFIKMKFQDFFIIKDYNFIYIIKKSNLIIFEKNIITEEDKKTFNIDLDLIGKFDIIITNDWEKWQSKIIYGSKKLSYFYKKNKVSYIKRYKNILVFDKTKKILLNKIN